MCFTSTVVSLRPPKRQNSISLKINTSTVYLLSPHRWCWDDVPAQRAGQAAGHRGVQHPGHGRVRHRPAAAQRRLLRGVRGQRQRGLHRLRPGLRHGRGGHRGRLRPLHAAQPPHPQDVPAVGGVEHQRDQQRARGVLRAQRRQRCWRRLAPRGHVQHERGLHLQRERPGADGALAVAATPERCLQAATGAHLQLQHAPRQRDQTID